MKPAVGHGCCTVLKETNRRAEIKKSLLYLLFFPPVFLKNKTWARFGVVNECAVKKAKILNEGLPVAYADPSVTPVPISALSVV